MLRLFGEIPAFHDDGAIALLGANGVLYDVQEPALHLLCARIVGIQLAWTTLPRLRDNLLQLPRFWPKPWPSRHCPPCPANRRGRPPIHLNPCWKEECRR